MNASIFSCMACHYKLVKCSAEALFFVTYPLIDIANTYRRGNTVDYFNVDAPLAG